MSGELTSGAPKWPRILGFISGLGMAATGMFAFHHFFTVNFPSAAFETSFWDSHRLFNCEPLAYSAVGQVRGVPLGYVGLVVGCLLCIGAIFPSNGFERTNRTIALLNVIGASLILLFSLVYLKSWCVLSLGYLPFAVMGVVALGSGKYFRPSLKHLAAIGVLAFVGAYGVSLLYFAKLEAQAVGAQDGWVERFFNLPKVKMPSVVSPFMPARATDKFEDAPIRVVVYGDFMCPDCLYFARQLARLRQEFEGELNVAFQFFPLDGECNKVVNKDVHPGSCELSYISAYDPSKFREIHDEIFENQQVAKDPEWRRELARRYGVEAALDDSKTKELVHRLIHSGTEYERTSAYYPFGIRSTPTIILNDRMIIGTLPYAQLRAIFRALLLRRQDNYLKGYIEHWMPPQP